MYQQRMKLQQISMIALALACLITVIAIVKSILLLMLLVYYGITLSLACEGFICLWNLSNKPHYAYSLQLYCYLSSQLHFCFKLLHHNNLINAYPKTTQPIKKNTPPNGVIIAKALTSIVE